MDHQHVVAGLRSCSISVALREREAGDGEEGQEEQAEGHWFLCSAFQSYYVSVCAYENMQKHPFNDSNYSKIV